MLRMSISLKGEIEFETSRLPLTSDLESRLFGLSRVRGVHPDEVQTRRGERSFFSNRHVRFDERGWETERRRMATLPRPSSTLPKLPIRNVRAVANGVDRTRRGQPNTVEKRFA